MIIDWRALCVDLVDWADYTSAHYYAPPEVLVRAHSALAEADEPAVPDGREPASVVREPSDELVAQWIAEVWHEGTPVRVAASDLHLASKAAEWGARYGHQPAPPAAGEALVTDELVRQLRTKAATEKANRCHYSATLLTRAADLLEQRQGSPVSVPTTERQP